MTDTLRDRAAAPASVTRNNVSVSQHSIKDQIDAEQYEGAKAAVAKAHRGIRRMRIIPPGTV